MLIGEVGLKPGLHHQACQCQGNQLGLEELHFHLIPLLQLLWFLKSLALGFEF